MLISDPAVVAVPILECGEPLRDITEQPALRLDPRKADPQRAYAKVRTGVLDRLTIAQASLPTGLHLLIIEGYRAPALQRAYFATYEAELQRLHPDRSPGEIAVLASRYVAPEDVAPHPAGAAVDLTLCRSDGVELDLGTPVNATPEASSGACYFAAPQVIGPARANRDLLSGVLTRAGLVNYPTEWWHWSYGDRYWAHATGAPHARYAPVRSRTVDE